MRSEHTKKMEMRKQGNKEIEAGRIEKLPDDKLSEWERMVRKKLICYM